jgi:hypothetical protein
MRYYLCATTIKQDSGMKYIKIISILFFSLFTGCDENSTEERPPIPGKISELGIDQPVHTTGSRKETLISITSRDHWSVTKVWNIKGADSLEFDNPFVVEGTRASVVNTDFANIFDRGKTLQIDLFDNEGREAREVLIQIDGVGLKTAYVRAFQSGAEP